MIQTEYSFMKIV